LVFGCGGGPADVQSPAQPSPGPLADLSPVAIEVPGQVRLDSLLQVPVVVHNGGARTAGPGWFVRLYLSADSLIASDDILIEQFAVTRELQPGTDDGYLRTMKLPGRTVPAAYYLGSILDVTGVAPELDEDNNSLLSPPALTILPKTPFGAD